MSGLSQILETARRALMAQQLGLSVTSNNIANASTPGYSRQRVDLVTTPPVRDSAGLLGTGVMAQGVTRLRNEFIDQQIRSTNQAMGRAGAEHDILSQVEATFNEPSDASMNTAISSFFNSWQALSIHPEDTVSRDGVLQQGQALVASFHQINSDLTKFRGSLQSDISTKVARINTLTKEISELEVQMADGPVTGLDYSDAKDQRDLKLEELSTLANISVSTDSRGGMMVSLGGMVVASRAGAAQLRVVPGNTATVSGSTFDQLSVVTDEGVSVDVTSGELGGVLKSYNSTIPEVLGKLDQLAQGIISAVNTAHAAGYGSGTPPSTGINFFSGTSAASIAIDLTDTSGGAAPGSAININNIAAAAGPPPPSAGDNVVALQIAGLVNQSQAMLGGSTITQFYSDLVTGIGTSITSAENSQTSHQLVLSQLQAQQDSVSGVSLDEEMTNLIQFQRAFDAAARLVNTANDMFQTLIDMV